MENLLPTFANARLRFLPTAMGLIKRADCCKSRADDCILNATRKKANYNIYVYLQCVNRLMENEKGFRSNNLMGTETNFDRFIAF